MLLVAAAFPGRVVAQARNLDIYFIDVEGGKSTLIVTPTGESLLIDAGFAGKEGRFNSMPGDPAQARDAQRVLLAAHDAGLTRIDHMLVSHYHADHFGGVMELAQLIPIEEYIDHSAPSAAAEARVPGTMALYDMYVKLRSKARHRAAKVGDSFSMGDVTVHVVANEEEDLTKPLPGGGKRNAACTSGGVPPQESTENPRSTAVKLQYGAFAYLDVGDLTGPPLYALTCPINLLGEVDVLALPHHGGVDGSDPSLYVATEPRVAVFSNSSRKGADAEAFNTIRQLGIAGWQLHRTAKPDAENMPDAQIANLDTSTAAWIKVSANRDGSFTVTNGRTKETVSYPKR
jgi:beta-lactamase superfamily II metal-dependent hydrolase